MNLPNLQIKNITDVPAAFVEQYIGAWSIDETWAKQFIDLHSRIDLAAHPKQIAAADGGVEVQDGVAIVQLRGMMTKRGSSFTQSEGTIAVRRQIREAASDPSIDSIMLVIESPGGTVSGTKELADDVRSAACAKPVIAFIEDIGASAAYYVASQATTVYANSPAMVGSIGTFMVLVDSSQAAEDVGVKVHVVRSADFKGVGEPGTEITEDHLSYFQALITAANAEFKSAVKRGRGFDESQLEAIATGKVFTATDAKRRGLIDGVQTFDETLANLKEQANMSDDVRKAATLKELQSALVGADNDFIVDQLGQEATLQEAQEAWIVEQQDRLEAASAEADKAIAEAKQGVEPVGELSASTLVADSSASDEWHAKIAAKMVRPGMDRMKAVGMVNRENPGLREAMLAESQS